MRAATRLLMAVMVLLLTACGTSVGGDANDDHGSKAPAAADPADQPNNTVSLTADMVRNLGVETSPAQAISFSPGATGLGVILPHDTVAQLAADLETAQAAVRQSQIALERARTLAGGPGALGADAIENANKQNSIDRAALTLAQRKLTAALGRKFPQNDLGGLADGTYQLARVTFPLGTPTPNSLQLIAPGSMAVAGTVWVAPQDPTIPGRSFYALLESDIAEGTRVQAVSTGGSIRGVLVPSAAIVAGDGQYWCYVRKNNTFTRIAVDINRSLPQGYFVTADRIAPGDAIVTAAAGLLQARQINPVTDEPD